MRRRGRRPSSIGRVSATPNDLASRLARATRFQRLIHLSECASTQDVALELEPGDAVVWADCQTSGRGRQGRVWSGEPGLDVEATLRVDAIAIREPALLAAAIPVAIVGALEAVADRRFALKWPNDVLCDGRKLSGVLIDAHGGRVLGCLVGVGVNVNRTRFPDPLREIATSLALATGREFDREAVVFALAESIDRALRDLVADRTAELESCFRDRLGLLGRKVIVETANGHRAVGRLDAVDFRAATLEDGRSFPIATLRRLERRRGEV